MAHSLRWMPSKTPVDFHDEILGRLHTLCSETRLRATSGLLDILPDPPPPPPAGAADALSSRVYCNTLSCFVSWRLLPLSIISRRSPPSTSSVASACPHFSNNLFSSKRFAWSPSALRASCSSTRKIGFKCLRASPVC
jgi:hypothetical protein